MLTHLQDDLAAFQSTHFDDPRDSVPQQIAKKTGKPEVEGEDDLGFYPDGSARSLTAAQIAIFRHSEIEQLIKSHQRHLHDCGEAVDEDDAPSLSESTVEPPMDFWSYAEQVRQNHILNLTRKSVRQAEKTSFNNMLMPNPPYNINSRQEKKRLNNRARNKRRKLALSLETKTAAFEDENDETGRTFRRIAREEDEIKQANDVDLDY
jgi:Protein of unknown function (DUF3807)